MKQYDAVIIGFGKGGKTLAYDLGKQGKSVAIIEKSPKMYGGTCPNVGCVPTKFLVERARDASRRNFSGFDERRAFYRKAIEDKNALTAGMRGANYHKLADLATVDVITGTARFIAPRELEVQCLGEVVRVRGRQIFLDTGSKAVIPAIAGADGKGVYTSETMLDEAILPERLVIVGGGYIGLEFASFYALFGTKVTVLSHSSLFLPRDEPEIAAEVKSVLESAGVAFEFGADVSAIEDRGAYRTVRFKRDGREYACEGDAVLLATGRKPNVEELNLNAAGVELLPDGSVKVDEAMRTTAPDVWAMGDVKGGPMFTYISLDDYRIVKSSLEGGTKTAKNRGAVPYCVFIRPAYSRIGMTESEARAAGYEVAVGLTACAGFPKAKVLEETRGLLKAVIDRPTGKILGCSLLCAESFELINLIKLAMDAGLPYTVLRDMIFTHPTMAEGLNDLFSAVR